MRLTVSSTVYCIASEVTELFVFQTVVKFHQRQKHTLLCLGYLLILLLRASAVYHMCRRMDDAVGKLSNAYQLCEHIVLGHHFDVACKLLLRYAFHIAEQFTV
jgi:hypothetical protein